MAVLLLLQPRVRVSSNPATHSHRSTAGVDLLIFRDIGITSLREMANK